MREILFRGRTKTPGKEWVNGFYAVHSTAPFIGAHNSYGTMLWFEVDPETVGQFTGLTDKNRKRIFDGDIIKCDNGKQSCVAVVMFGEYYPKMFYKMLDMCSPGKRHMLANGFYAKSVDKGEEMILFQSLCVEVIGNIYDNPELLEG